MGDRAILIEFGNVISREVNHQVHALDRALSQVNVEGVEECVPSYRSLLVYFNPSTTNYNQLVTEISNLEGRLEEFTCPTRESVIEVPVVYGGEYGPDLSYVAEYHSINEDEVVHLHCSREYTVYMIGFVAGFPYLGEVADEIAIPRHETPRLRVPEGSVGLAEKQTGIYPCESPGGWQIIGRTPLKFFDPNSQPPALIHPGDTVRFKPIGREEFENFLQDRQK